MIRTVIFDMDGVVIDTEPIHHNAFFTHFAELGIQVPAELYATFLGSSTRNMYQRIKREFGLSDDVELLMNRKRELFNKEFDENQTLDLLPGVRHLIEDLHEHGVQLVLASSASKATIKRVFTRFELYPYFSHLVSGEDFTESKPNPEIFNHAADLAQTPKNECIIIEDSTNGIAAAKAAGIYCIGYASEHSAMQDLHLASQVIKHFDELSAEKIIAITPAGV
ncbi:HAD family hydrolase [Hymenobacter crusticola]|uniref:ABC transporter ATP-binding protein n=1 Tax=Hymenobacter crusticola TaxID=1770526 RepID=A0A243W8L7_9BACT|nr:HAD-IA family hydrolase [Hymenobacter crusticola]OUJ71367.1 ABC transporter ATP-binding protein [Hymenobacter crusticola]